jgi:hypothetical protein
MKGFEVSECIQKEQANTRNTRAWSVTDLFALFMHMLVCVRACELVIVIVA